MQKGTEERLKYFITQDTWQSGHPSDFERFYEFVAEAYRNNDIEISFDEFFSVIKNLRGDDENIKDIAEKYYLKYETGIEAIRVFDRS